MNALSSTNPVEYVAAGFALVPVARGKKYPTARDWQLEANAIRTEERAATLAGCNIGLAHRWSGTCAIDVDKYQEANAWLTERGIDLQSHLIADDAVKIDSGRSNRAKLLYRLPVGINWLPSLTLAGDSLEMRCASHDGTSSHQDVLPPSIHPDTGKPYQWGGAGDWRNLPTLPPDLLALWRDQATPAAPRAGAAARMQPRSLSEGGRNTHLTSLAGTMRRCGMDQAAIEAALLSENEAKCLPPLAAGEVRAIAASVARYEPAQTAAGELSPHLRAVNLDDLMGATVDAPGFVCEPLIPRGHVTLLTGHGGAGKSNLALIMAAHAACGKPWSHFRFEQCRTVFVSLEDGGDLARFRLRNIAEQYQLDATTIANNLVILDGTEGSTPLVTEMSDGGVRKLISTPLFDLVANAAAGAGLVAVDNASDAFDGDENSRRQVRTFVRKLARIAKENDAGLILLAHIDKAAARGGGNGNAYSGSTAWHNSARSRVALTMDERKAVTLVHEKCNLAKKANPLPLAWVEPGVLVPASTTTAAHDDVADAILLKSDTDHLLTVLALAIKVGHSVSCATAGPATAWHTLKSFPELGKQYHSRAGKQRVQAALVKLVRENRIFKCEYQNAQRHYRERWELTQTHSNGSGSASVVASKSASVISPIPPCATDAAHRGARQSRQRKKKPRSDATDATDAKPSGKAPTLVADADAFQFTDHEMATLNFSESELATLNISEHEMAELQRGHEDDLYAAAGRV